ncbi:hypothetical protein B0H11DRAFT_2200487 [Mycena galericulata]|nr:hypothetical protein B0H11DRAFT_2200487 [Mycena galericulata]
MPKHWLCIKTPWAGSVNNSGLWPTTNHFKFDVQLNLEKMPVSLLPAPGAFVVIDIDPMATLQYLNDPIATAAAEKMARRKYVGYVNRVIDAFDWRTPYHIYAVSLTSPTIPERCENGCTGGDMYTPVLPTVVHPLGREPLRPSQDLPWKACSQSSSMCTVVRVPVRLEDDSAAVFISQADVIRHRRILAEDEFRRNLVLSSAPKTRGASCVNFNHLEDAAGDFLYEHPFSADIVDPSRPPQTAIVVNVSYDLSQVHELPDPVGFFEERRYLKRLTAESCSRKANGGKNSTGDVEDVPQDPRPIDQPVTQATLLYFDNPWSPWDYRQMSSIRIPASIIREAARRVSLFLARIGEGSLNLLQTWTFAVRL